MSQAINQVIPEGYKQMGLGLIPEDWEVVTLDDAANFLDGQRRPVKSGDRARIKGQYPYYGASGIVDYVNDYIFDGEFILLGEDGENILSRNLPLAFKASGKIWVNNHAHVMTPKANFQIDFLTSYLESLDYSLLNSGTAQPKLNKQSCLNIKVIKPLYEEQTAIANALSDVDALLSELENLIAKKQAIKTATMQQLLTGKTRLPQFAFYSDINSTEDAVEGKRKHSSATNVNVRACDDGSLASQESRGMDSRRKSTKPSELGEIPEDWDIKNLGYLLEDNRIPSGLYKDKNLYGAGTAIIKLGDVFKNDSFNPDIVQRVKTNNIENKAYSVKIGDLVIALASVKLEGVGKVMMVNELSEPTVYDHNVALIRFKENYNSNFMSFLFKSNYIRSLVASRATQVGTTFLKTSTILAFPILLPSPEEQTAIATILSDMDNEIQTLEQRLSKTRQIKQGMMQELLTGKTRLPFDKDTISEVSV